MPDSNMDIGRGCLDCLNKETPTTKLPCRDCEKWSRWEPKEKKKDI